MAEPRTVEQKIKAYSTVLKTRGIPAKFVKEMMVDITNSCMKEARDLRFERIYTAIALSIRNFTKHKDGKGGWKGGTIINYLEEFNRIFDDTAEDKITWDKLMEKLDLETGIVVRQGSTKDRLICEYIGNDLNRVREILEAEAEMEEV